MLAFGTTGNLMFTGRTTVRSVVIVTGRSVGNLPPELTSFVGRRTLTGDVRSALSTAPLITLTGPAGVGKSRLAIHVARAASRAFPEGAWVADLGEVADPGLVFHAITTALTLPSEGTSTPDQTLVNHLTDRHLLLILDNCEHLVGACATVAATLLRGAPGVRVIATSREVLGVTGEHVFTVPPLDIPQSVGEPGVPDTIDNESVRLFEQRAAAVRPDFIVTPDNYHSVMAVCAALDGLPLAIELAAGRLRALSVHDLRRRLADNWRILEARMRDAPPRQRTLYSAIEWSYRLCSPKEQQLWSRLAAFTGGFTLDSASEVCAFDDLTRDNVLDGILGLVEKSIVASDVVGEITRYRLLGPLRQFGRDRLAEDATADVVDRRLLDHYRVLIRDAETGWSSLDQARWADRISAEHATIRATLSFALTDEGDSAAAIEMAAGLWFFWASGAAQEGREWLGRAIAAAPGSPCLAKAYWAQGLAALTQGDVDSAWEALSSAREVAHATGDGLIAAYASQFLATAAHLSDDLEGALARYNEAIAHYSETDTWTAVSLLGLAQQGWVQLLIDDVEGARASCQRCLDLGSARGQEWTASWAHWVLGIADWQGGEFKQARDRLCTSLRIKRDLNDRLGIPFDLEAMAWVAHSRGAHERAAHLLGSTAKLWTPLGKPLFGFKAYVAVHNQVCAEVEQELGAGAFERAFGAGSLLSAAEAVSLALEEQPDTPVGARTLPSALTKRERQVASLVAQGMTNSDIASALVISKRTAEAHVEHILRKLDFTSRAEIAAWAARNLGEPDNVETPPPTPRKHSRPIAGR